MGAQDMWRETLQWLANRCRTRIIGTREDNQPYLFRSYLLGGPRTWEEGQNTTGTYGKLPINIMLHRFVQSDDDSALHNHPWRWSISLILAGGYTEERRVAVGPYDLGIRKKTFRPFQFNVIRNTDYHRVDLLEKDCWSLFVSGPKCGTWYFWDRASGVTTQWLQFIKAKRHS